MVTVMNFNLSPGRKSSIPSESCNSITLVTRYLIGLYPSLNINLIVFRAGCCKGGGPVAYHDPSQEALRPGHHQTNVSVFLIDSRMSRFSCWRDEAISRRAGEKLQQAYETEQRRDAPKSCDRHIKAE